MNKPKNQSNDPFSGAVKSLVVKTVITLSVIAIIFFGAVGFIIIKNKSKSTQAKTIQESPTPTQISEVLSVTTTPTTSSNPTPSPTASPTSLASAQPSPTNSPTPLPTAIPTKSSSATTPTPTPSPQTKTISATSSLDGYQSSVGDVISTADIRIGATKTKTTRGFISFDLTSQKIQVKKATFKLFQAKVEGNPYTQGGQIKIDTLNYGNTFDSSDYSISSNIPSFATLSDNTNSEWKSVDITQILNDAIAQAKTNIQFRIHFTIESLGKTDLGDFAIFESSENTLKTNNTPQISIE